MSDKSNPYGAPDTGHVWDDDLRELLNPPPKWWMIGLHASWILVVLYGVFYPMVPLVNSHTKGLLGWTSIQEFERGVAQIEQIREPFEQRLQGMSAAAILEDSELLEYVNRSAHVLYGDNCAACHATGGAGNPGFPILANDDWLYGGDVNTILASITHGRRGNMPSHGHLSDQEINDVARHVQALSQGGEYAPGKVIFEGAGACFACHGMDGTGMQALGAPNLTNGIWRWGNGNLEAIAHTIRHGVNAANDPQTRNADMPAFGGTRLSETDLTKLAVYVHQLGGGQ